MATFHLIMRSGPSIGRTYALETSETTLGRDAANRIAINDVEISRKHARILKQGEEYLLEDLGSTNGTFINGQRISGSHPIKIGDMIAMGENVVLQCEADFDPDATMLSARAAKAEASVPAAPVPAPVAAAPVIVPAPAPIPASEPVFADQVPESPEAPPRKMSRKKLLLIIIAALIVLCICGVSVFLYFAPRSFWCGLPFIVWPPGTCP